MLTVDGDALFFVSRAGSMGPSSVAAQPQKATVFQVSTRLGRVAAMHGKNGHAMQPVSWRVILSTPLLSHTLLGMFALWTRTLWGSPLSPSGRHNLRRLQPHWSLPQHRFLVQVPSECDGRTWHSEADKQWSRNCNYIDNSQQLVVQDASNLENVVAAGCSRHTRSQLLCLSQPKYFLHDVFLYLLPPVLLFLCFIHMK